MQEILQNTTAYTRLLAQREEPKPSHAYLLVYDDPTHTKTALKSLAKIFFYAEENGYNGYDSSEQERIARLIDGEKYADCLVYPKNEKRLNVEECERIIEECFVHAVEGEKKVILIDRIDEALPTAQNKLLKVLEEPHEGVVFLLSARTTYPVLQTVLSRTQRLEIPPLSIEEVGACLRRNKKITATPAEIHLVSALSCGSVGTAEGLLEAGYYKTLLSDAFALCECELDRLPIAAKQAGTTKNKKELVSILRLIFRDAAFLKLGQKEQLLLAPEKERIACIAQKFSHTALIYAQERFSAVEKEVVFNANFTQAIELCMARILEVN